MRLSHFFSSLVVLAALVAAPNVTSATSSPQVGLAVSVRIGPPILPVYAQPICPGEGYIWEPGYWAYDDVDGYYWVPGTWVLPPEAGLLWTPGYWGFSNGLYVWNTGYWGPVVGFYGGINYGFGYPGTGFYGGYWRGGQYFYNRSVTNINTTIVHNVYNTTVMNRSSNVTRVSFNGGPGGVQARPTSAETRAMQERHVGMTREQQQFRQSARNDRNLFASVNHGRPDVAATSRPSEMNRYVGPVGERPVAPNRPGESPSVAPRATERPSARTPERASRPAPARPNERPPAHELTPAPRSEPSAKPAPAPSRSERPAAHQPAPAPRPTPTHPNERPQHNAPPAARPAPVHPQNRPAQHQPAPAAKPHAAPQPAHPAEHNSEQPKH